MSSVQIKLEVQGDDQVVRSFVQAATAVQQSSDRMRQAARQSTEAQATGLARVSEAMREYRAEEVQQGRSIRFFTQELAGVLPVSDGVAQAIGRVAGSLSMGFGLGLALEAVKWGLETFTAGMKKAKEESEAFHKSISDTLQALAEGPSKAKILAAQGKISELQEIIANAPARIAEIRARDVSLTGKRAREAIEAQVEEAQREIPRLERLIEVSTAALAQTEGKFHGPPVPPEKAAKAPDFDKLDMDRLVRLNDVEKGLQRERVAAHERAAQIIRQQREEEQRSLDEAHRAELKQIHEKEEAQRDAASRASVIMQRAAQEQMRQMQMVASAINSAFQSAVAAGGDLANRLKAFFVSLGQQILDVITKILIMRAVMSAFGIGGGFGEAAGAVLGFDIPKAAGGYDIPLGVNPIVQAHGGEMILPRDIADPLREGLADGGGAGITVNITGQVVDREGIERFFVENGRSIVKSIRREAVNRRT